MDNKILARRYQFGETRDIQNLIHTLLVAKTLLQTVEDASFGIMVDEATGNIAFMPMLPKDQEPNQSLQEILESRGEPPSVPVSATVIQCQQFTQTPDGEFHLPGSEVNREND